MSVPQPKTLGEKILDKLKARIILALLMSGIFSYVVYAVINTPSLKDNPVLMLVLGGLLNVITMIYIFYFRKAQSKESDK